MSPMKNAFALIIGIANYHYVRKLPQTVLKDSRGIHDVLVDVDLCGYQKDNIRLLVDGDATRKAILEAFANLGRRTDSDSTIFIYISSHGGRIDSGPWKSEYLLPVDVKYESDEKLAATAISGAEFTTILSAIQARKLVVIFDCCHSGGIGQPKDLLVSQLKALPESYYETLQTGRGRVILASSRSTEYSYVRPEADNSLFTQHFLAGLRGGVPGPGGVIRIFDIFNYVQPRVTAEQPNQHPIFKAELEDNFPIALYLGGKASAPTALPPRISDFEYDVFLSYWSHEPDRAWVRKALRPKLEADGLRVCIDHRDFRLGAPLILEMARAVEQSRYTLVIMTPGYLTSNFAELENILAEHLGLEKSQRRLLAIMREYCTPRLGLRVRLWLDMTDDSEFETNVQRLIYELRLPPEK